MIIRINKWAKNTPDAIGMLSSAELEILIAFSTDEASTSIYNAYIDAHQMLFNIAGSNAAEYNFYRDLEDGSVYTVIGFYNNEDFDMYESQRLSNELYAKFLETRTLLLQHLGVDLTVSPRMEIDASINDLSLTDIKSMIGTQ